jgi:hypothetical protein
MRRVVRPERLNKEIVSEWRDGTEAAESRCYPLAEADIRVPSQPIEEELHA